MLVSSPRPKHSVTGFPDKVGNVCYKVLQCPDTLRHAKTWISGQFQNTRYINKISTLWIIYHQKGLDEEIPKQQTKLHNLCSILYWECKCARLTTGNISKISWLYCYLSIFLAILASTWYTYIYSWAPNHATSVHSTCTEVSIIPYLCFLLSVLMCPPSIFQ